MSALVDSPIVVEGISHYFGSGALRKQILFDITTEIKAGEIIIMTGPSGSGKTTLLTLIGALRSVHEGKMRVLGQELYGASPGVLVGVRRKIGFIFQAHNLLKSLTARQNVNMTLRLHSDISPKAAHARTEELLRAVGLGERMDYMPDKLSGGQKQRVAIARALAPEPRIILADEPTASLDRKSGRDVVEIMQGLAKKQGTTVLLVTHDNRILDIADRVLHMEDGHLTSYASQVLSSTRSMLDAMARTNRAGEIAQKVKGLGFKQFSELLSEVTGEFEEYLRVIKTSNSEAFESMLEQVLESFTLKFGELLQADRASLFIVDEARGELWSKVTKEGVEIRVPIGQGIAGRVAQTGKSMNVPDAYAETLFSKKADQETGYRTKTMLCMPIVGSTGKVTAVVQLLNKVGGLPFDSSDETRFREFSAELGVVLETWKTMKDGQAKSLPGEAGATA